MTIASEIQRIKTNIENAYDALENLGATMPATEDTDHLVSTIQTVSTGDEVSAKNVSGSAVSSGDKVWIDEHTDVSYIDNYETYISSGTLTISDEKLFASHNLNCIYNDSPTSNATTREIVVKLKTSSFSFTSTHCAKFFANNSPQYQSNSWLIALWFGYWTTAMTWVFSAYSQYSTTLKAVPDDISSFPTNDYFYIKIAMTSNSATSYYSFDGESWTTIETKSVSLINNFTGDSYKYCLIGNGGYDGEGGKASVYVDLTGCYVMKDGDYEWNVVDTLVDTYTAIVPFADITEEALSGVAQENIAVDATGTVKTILP